MKHKRVLLQASNLLMILLLLVSCSRSPNTAEIKKIVYEAGRVEPLAKEKDEITEKSESRDKNFKYIYEKHDVVDNIDSIVYLGLNDDIIWPGSLVRGDKAHNFVYEPISVDRAPITLSISLEGSPATGESITQQVEKPKLSTVRQGISDLLKKSITANTRVPAKVEFSYQQIYNESQMNLFVGADISYGVGNLSTRFNWDSTTKKNKIMARYRQIYYSIDVDPPQSPADFFAPSMTTTELTAAMPAGSRPLYIAGVSYGMMALMFIETDSSVENMKAALDAAYGGFVDVDVSVKTEYTNILQSSNINIVVYGGSTAGLKDLETGYQGFKNVIEASKDFDSNSPGVPLIYKFRHLSDNTLALVTLTSQYTLVKPLRVQQEVEVTVVKFECTHADDEGADNTVDMDRFMVYASAYDGPSASGEPGSPIIPENTQVYYWDYGGGELGMDEKDTLTTTGKNSFFITFDTESHDFNLAKLVLYAKARDWDTTGDDEWGDGGMEILGRQFFENGGEHIFKINSRDFEFKVYIMIKLVED